MDLLDLAQGYPYISIYIDDELLQRQNSFSDFAHFKNVTFLSSQKMSQVKSSEVHVFMLNQINLSLINTLKENNVHSFVLIGQKELTPTEQIICVDWENMEDIRKKLVEIDELAFDLRLYEYQVEWMNMLLRMSKEAKDYLINIKKEILNCFNSNEISIEANEVISFFEELAELRLNAFSCAENKDFFKVINSFIRKGQYVEEIGIDFKDQIYKDLTGQGLNYYYVPIPRNDEFVYIRYSLNSKKGPFKYLVLIVVLNLIDTYLFRDQLKFEAQNESLLIDLVFKNFPYPMVLISDDGELLSHNKSFENIEILPNTLLSIGNKKQISIGNVDYIVDRIRLKNQSELHPEINLFVLVSMQSAILGLSDQKLNSLSNEQLGIISSSIAHELKNPIAGVLAAIDYLKLGDSIGEETLQDLESMKQSLSRCRELVDIFLGFSRADTGNREETLSLKQCLEKALTLMKFRMVENHCMIENSKFSSEAKFSKSINTSVLTMIIYVSLSEALTSFAHYRLVAGPQNKNSHLQVELVERADAIELKFPNLKDSLDRIENSKLIQHLTDYIGISIETESNRIRFCEWKLRS